MRRIVSKAPTLIPAGPLDLRGDFVHQVERTIEIAKLSDALGQTPISSK